MSKPGKAERAALAEAIQVAEAAERELRAIHKAVEIAAQRRSQAAAELGNIRTAGADQTASFGRVFMESVRAGNSESLETLEARAESFSEKEAEAARRVEMWAKAESEAKSQLDGATNAVFWARKKIDLPLRALVQTSGAAEAIYDGITELRDALIERRAALDYLLRNGMVADDLAPQVRAFLNDTDMPGATVTFNDWTHHPAYVAWASAHAALISDSEAPLPVVSDAPSLIPRVDSPSRQVANHK